MLAIKRFRSILATFVLLCLGVGVVLGCIYPFYADLGLLFLPIVLTVAITVVSTIYERYTPLNRAIQSACDTLADTDGHTADGLDEVAMVGHLSGDSVGGRAIECIFRYRGDVPAKDIEQFWLVNGHINAINSHYRKQTSATADEYLIAPKAVQITCIDGDLHRESDPRRVLYVEFTDGETRKLVDETVKLPGEGTPQSWLPPMAQPLISARTQYLVIVLTVLWGNTAVFNQAASSQALDSLIMRHAELSLLADILSQTCTTLG